MTPALRSALKAWQALPVRARKDACHFFRDEAKQSDDWARLLSVDGPSPEAKRHRENAAALRAAVKLLRAAGRPK